MVASMARSFLPAAPNIRWRREALLATAAIALALGCPSPVLAGAPNMEGRWSDVSAWPRIPIHSALTPDGKVVTFGATPQNNQGGLDIDIWDPKLGLGDDAHVTLPNSINVDSFCTGQVIEAWSGELLMVGGSNNADDDNTYKTSSFSYKTRALTALQRVAYPRWYATTTTLPDGRIIVNGGVKPYSNSADASTTAELFTPGQGWRALTGTTQARQGADDHERRYWYPRVFPTANNKIFVLAGKIMYRIGYDGNGSFGDVQPFDGPNWGGTASTVLFAPNKILQFGGGITFNEDQSAPAGSRNASIIDFSTFPYKVSDTGQMAYGRHWVTGTVLPTGEVLATGGAEGNNTLQNVAYAAEIWNPQSGQWRTGASMKVPRLYHSTALLLPDGRVLVGGGGAPGPVTGNNVEVYSPPYLFGADGNLATRPVISSEPGTVRLGQTIQVSATGNRPIARFTMVKTGAVTHSFNTDQRFLEVPFTKSGDGYALTLTGNALEATPGYYMLFALDDQGVPSIGKMMRLPSPTADNGDTPPPAQNGETGGLGPVVADTGGNAGNAGGTNAGGAAIPADGNATPLIASHSNLCLSVQGGGDTEGAQVLQETCNGSAIQKWTWKQANGGYTLVNSQTNKCLDVYNFKTDDGAALVQWGCWGGDNQIWKPTQTAQGLTLMSKQTGKCVDVAGVSMQSGAQVFQWTCNGQANQAWTTGTAGNGNTANGNTGGGATSGDVTANAPTQWTQIGTQGAKIASAADGTTLTVNSGDGTVWRYQSDNNWVALNGQAMKEVAAGGANRIYGIGTDSAIYRWTGTAWTRVGGWGRTISAASDGTVVITNDKNEIWRKNADDFNDGWTRVNGTSAKVVAIAANRFWSMGADGKVYRYDGNGNWNQVGVTISDIAASADGSISVVNTTTREIWRKTTDDNNGNWTKAMGKGLQVAAPSARWLVVVGTDRNLYRFAPNG
ncbi:hypothetical protein NS365_14775 [Aureimonas ureilytica]|uniref:Ricin B lectin domain-containing protein n=2 Tax=Aureimonas ureilytica TaxID=401562 RepID=A0A175RLI0_9HYPH|nr:hypothetical protein NS365_14775 [Aureimonas ureilytica]